VAQTVVTSGQKKNGPEYEARDELAARAIERWRSTNEEALGALSRINAPRKRAALARYFRLAAEELRKIDFLLYLDQQIMGLDVRTPDQSIHARLKPHELVISLLESYAS